MIVHRSLLSLLVAVVAAAAPAASASAAAAPNADPLCPEEQRLQTRPGQPLTVTVACSDPDGDLLTYQLASRSEHATIEQSGPATFLYTSTRDFRGEDGILVLARDLGADGAIALGFRCGKRAARASCRATATVTAGRQRLASTTRTAATGTLNLLLVRLSAGARRQLAAHPRAALTLRASVRGSDGRTRQIARPVPRTH